MNSIGILYSERGTQGQLHDNWEISIGECTQDVALDSDTT